MIVEKVLGFPHVNTIERNVSTTIGSIVIFQAMCRVLHNRWYLNKPPCAKEGHSGIVYINTTDCKL